MRKWRCLFAPFDARLAFATCSLDVAPARRSERTELNITSTPTQISLLSLPSWRVSGGITGLFSSFSSKLRPSSPQSVTRTFLLWRKSAFRYVPLPAPSLHRSHLRTREHDSALPRSPAVFFCLSSRRARARLAFHPSQSLLSLRVGRTDGPCCGWLSVISTTKKKSRCCHDFPTRNQSLFPFLTRSTLQWRGTKEV